MLDFDQLKTRDQVFANRRSIRSYHIPYRSYHIPTLTAIGDFTKELYSFYPEFSVSHLILTCSAQATVDEQKAAMQKRISSLFTGFFHSPKFKNHFIHQIHSFKVGKNLKAHCHLMLIWRNKQHQNLHHLVRSVLSSNSDGVLCSFCREPGSPDHQTKVFESSFIFWASYLAVAEGQNLFSSFSRSFGIRSVSSFKSLRERREKFGGPSVSAEPVVSVSANQIEASLSKESHSVASRPSPVCSVASWLFVQGKYLREVFFGVLSSSFGLSPPLVVPEPASG